MTFSSIFDIAIALIVASFAVRGLFRGLSGEIFSLLGTVGGVIVAWKYSGVPAAWILSMFPEANPSMVSVGFMVAIYIGVVVLAASICRIVKAFLRFASFYLISIYCSILTFCKNIFVVLAPYALIRFYTSASSNK